ncbi:MAG: PilN domain-containing protein [Syntrophomonas sp.]|nr:PilN domain-containing protein [Syntrophomonas sp.]
MGDFKQININLFQRARINWLTVPYWIYGLISMAMIAALLALFYLSLKHGLNYQQIVYADLHSQIQAHNDEAFGFMTLQELEKKLAFNNQAVIEIEKPRLSFSDTLREIDKARPAGALIAEIDIESRKAVVKGFSPDHNHVARLLEGLQDNVRFNKVTVISSIMDEKTDATRFTMEFELEVEKK